MPVDVMLQIRCQGSDWAEDYAKQVQLPILLPVGSTIYLNCKGAVNNFDLTVFEITEYDWIEPESMASCHLEDITDIEFTKAWWDAGMKSVGWATLDEMYDNGIAKALVNAIDGPCDNV